MAGGGDARRHHVHEGVGADAVRLGRLHHRRDAQQPTGKWVGEAEYVQDRFVCNPGQTCRHRREYSTYCSTVYGPASGFAAVKFDVNLDGSVFYPCPNGT